MNNFLDKTGLEYLYNKLCKVFMLKGSKVRIDLMSEDIQNALGYTPISQELLDSSIESIRDDQKYFRDNFEELLSKVDEARVIVDSNTNTITSFAGRFNKNEQTINTVKSQLSANTASIENLAKSYDDNNKQLTTVVNKLDAQNASINNIISRANTQGVAINSIRQLITDTLNSIKASVSMGEVEAAIEAKVFDDNGLLKSDITLSADQITVGEIGSNVNIAGWNVTQHGFAKEHDHSFDINSGCGYMYNTTLSTKNLDFESYTPPYCYLEDTFEEAFNKYKGNVFVNKTILSPKEGLSMYNGNATKFSNLAVSPVISKPVLQEVLNVNPNGNIYFNVIVVDDEILTGNICFNGVDSETSIDTSINHKGVTFNHSTEGEVTISWEDIYNLINK